MMSNELPRPNSGPLTTGPERAPARAMLRAVGLSDADLQRPQVAVASSWNEVTPCNLHLNGLAAAAKDGVRQAGAVPFEFGTIAVSDGISMGTEGMKASLVSREIIADSVELMVHAERFDALGMALPGSATAPAVPAERTGLARLTGEVTVQALAAGLRPRQIMTRAAFLNAAAVVMATAGSTNAVLHLLAIANDAEVELTLDDFDAVSRRTPHIVSVRPAGRFIMSELDQAGGLPVVLRELLSAGLVGGDALSVNGRTLAENVQDAFAPDGDVVRAVKDPFKPDGGLAILRGTLAPRGAVVKTPGIETLRFEGRARVFEREEDCMAAVTARAVASGDVLDQVR